MWPSALCSYSILYNVGNFKIYPILCGVTSHNLAYNLTTYNHCNRIVFKCSDTFSIASLLVLPSYPLARIIPRFRTMHPDFLEKKIRNGCIYGGARMAIVLRETIICANLVDPARKVRDFTSKRCSR